MKVATISDLIRRRLEKDLPRRKPVRDELLKSQWSPLFEQLMRNRLVMGAMRYETFDEKHEGHSYDVMASVVDRADLYRQTGNVEHLVDIANLCMIEFECPSHVKANWDPVDDGVHVGKR